MQPSRDDVQAMVTALFTVVGGVQRATRQSKQASALALLQIIGEHGRLRLAEIAGRQQVHPSLVTRQVRELEEQGYVVVEADPGDRRAWLVSLTPEGIAESRRLYEIGMQRFELFVAGWEDSEVRQLAALLEKFARSAAAANEPGPHPGRRRRERKA